ncbi:unnamed protein product, partial [Didymodactylos carnosus]
YSADTIKILLHKDPSPPKPSIWDNKPIRSKPDSILSADERRQKQATIVLDDIYVAAHPPKKKFVPGLIDFIYTKRIVQKPVDIIYVKDGGRIIKGGDDINSASFQSDTKTPPEQEQLARFIDAHKSALPISGREIVRPRVDTAGKIMGFLQTAKFLRGHLSRLIIGAGL